MAAKAEGRDPCKNRERQCCVMWTAGMMPTPPRTVRAACRGQSGLRKFYDAHRGARDERALATYPEGYVAAHTVGRARVALVAAAHTARRVRSNTAGPAAGLCSSPDARAGTCWDECPRALGLVPQLEARVSVIKGQDVGKTRERKTFGSTRSVWRYTTAVFGGSASTSS